MPRTFHLMLLSAFLLPACLALQSCDDVGQPPPAYETSYQPIIGGTDDITEARTVHSKYIGG